MNSEQHEYWNDFYAGKDSRNVPARPSPFAFWARDRMLGGSTVWEFGFGTGRDSVWLSCQGYSVRGFDFAESAVEIAQRTAQSHGLSAKFSILDLYDVAQTQELIHTEVTTRDINIYGRFLLHSLEDKGRHNLLDIASEVMKEGYLLLEFRTGQDAKNLHLFGEDHYRQYLDPQVVVDEIADRGGHVVERLEGYGLAVYKTEDPHVARLAATWGSPQDPVSTR
jgi:hypothetical protein